MVGVTFLLTLDVHERKLAGLKSKEIYQISIRMKIGVAYTHHLNILMLLCGRENLIEKLTLMTHIDASPLGKLLTKHL